MSSFAGAASGRSGNAVRECSSLCCHTPCSKASSGKPSSAPTARSPPDWRALHRNHTQDLRLVSRTPRKVDASDTVFAANLLDARRTLAAVRDSDTVYFTAGLPPDAKLWEAQFPVMLRNALAAARTVGAPVAYFDNTYMYPQDARL